METKVAGILGALSQLEQDLDSLESSVSDMKKSRTINCNSEPSHPVSFKFRCDLQTFGHHCWYLLADAAFLQ